MTMNCYMCGVPFECKGCLAEHIRKEAPYSFELCCEDIGNCDCSPHSCKEHASSNA